MTKCVSLPLSSMCGQAFKVFTALQRACLAVAGVAAVWALGASAAGLTLRTPRLALSVLAAVAGAPAVLAAVCMQVKAER